MTDDELTGKIIGCAFKVHKALGSGFLEKVYENALRIELEKLGFADSKNQSMFYTMATRLAIIMPIFG
jgi:GxxExxY protein